MRTSQLDQTLPVQILANEGPKTLECSRVDRCARTTKQQLDLCRHVWHLCVRSFVEAEMSLNLLGKVVGPVLSLAGGLIGIIVGVGLAGGTEHARLAHPGLSG